jgi:hypothetical protein
MEGKTKMPFVYWTWLVARGLFLLAPFIHTPALFVLLVCAAPIIFSVSNPAYAAIMKEIYPDALRGRLMSFVRIGVYFSMLGSSLIMGRLLDHGLAWQTAFFIGGVFGALSAVAFRRIPLLPMPPSEEGRGSTIAFFRDTFGILGRNPGYRWFLRVCVGFREPDLRDPHPSAAGGLLPRHQHRHRQYAEHHLHCNHHRVSVLGVFHG